MRERKKKYDRILFCLDKDEAGEKGCQVLKEELSGLGKIERYDYQHGDDPSEEWIIINRSGIMMSVRIFKIIKKIMSDYY